VAGHVVKLALGAILLVVPPSQLRAECVGFPLKHYLKSADLVFSGRIQGLEQRDSIRTIVTFDVDRVWKGEVGRRLVLHQAVENIDSFRFVQGAIGAKYLVFATRLDARQRQEFELPERADAFGIPTCGGGTRKIDANDPILRQLGRGRNANPGGLTTAPGGDRIHVPRATGATVPRASWFAAAGGEPRAGAEANHRSRPAE